MRNLSTKIEWQPGQKSKVLGLAGGMLLILISSSFLAGRFAVSPIPFTLAPVVVLVGALLLDVHGALLFTFAFILIGLLLPIYPGIRAHMAVLMGPDGGFIIALPILGGIAGLAFRAGHPYFQGRETPFSWRQFHSFWRALVLVFTSAFLSYLVVGLLFYRYSVAISWRQALRTSLVPLAPYYAIELLLALLLARTLWPLAERLHAYLLPPAFGGLGKKRPENKAGK